MSLLFEECQYLREVCGSKKVDIRNRRYGKPVEAKFHPRSTTGSLTSQNILYQ